MFYETVKPKEGENLILPLAWSNPWYILSEIVICWRIGSYNIRSIDFSQGCVAI